MEDFDVLYKIVVVGEASVGKTNLLAYYMQNNEQISSADGNTVAPSFSASRRPTIGVEFGTKTVVHPDGTRIRAQIWDTAGQERYRAITSSHYRRAAGALLVYDVTNPQSFNKAITIWLKELRDASDAEQGILNSIMLVGNKIDLENATKEDGQPTFHCIKEQEQTQACIKEKLFSRRTSAKTGQGVVEAFTELLIAVHNNAKNRDEEQDINQTVILGRTSAPVSNSTCSSSCMSNN